jgi:hypothetical protein
MAAPTADDLSTAATKAILKKHHTVADLTSQHARFVLQLLPIRSVFGQLFAILRGDFKRDATNRTLSVFSVNFSRAFRTMDGEFSPANLAGNGFCLNGRLAIRTEFLTALGTDIGIRV